MYKIYLGFICIFIINSVQGRNETNCGLSVRNARIELTCTCADGEVPYGWFCFPTDTKCPNGYYDIFEERCKCMRYTDEDDEYSQCENLCDDECTNGVCIPPGKCACNPGYSMSTNGTNKCEPVCKDGCEHGVCVAPGKCNCNEGYSVSESNKCKPICEGGCTNGYCLYPNWCSCDTGYKRIAGVNNCVADCPNGCTENSFCASPGECLCMGGYTMTDDGTCQEYVEPSSDYE